MEPNLNQDSEEQIPQTTPETSEQPVVAPAVDESPAVEPEMTTPVNDTAIETPTQSSESQVFTPQSSTTNEPSSPSEPVASISVTSAPSAESMGPVSGSSKKSFFKRWWKKLAIIVAVILVLGGSSAAAFRYVYLPKQPWYILDTALENTLSQSNVNLNATINTTSSGVAMKILSLTKVNFNNKQVDENINLTVDGVAIPAEIRLVNSNLYIKLGDLSTLTSLLSTLGGSSAQGLGSTFAPLLSGISNQWVVIDSTTLDSNKAYKCLMESSWTTSSSDSNYIVNSYLNKPFLNVLSMTSDTIGSSSEYKMSVNLSDNTAASYLNGLNNLSSSQSYNQCTGSKNTTITGDNKTRPLTIWVNKSTKLIDQVEYASSQSGASGSIDALVSYGTVNVQVPPNAIPLAQLFAQIMETMTKQGNTQGLQALNSLMSNL